jgi:hypothetical protein
MGIVVKGDVVKIYFGRSVAHPDAKRVSPLWDWRYGDVR